MIFALMAVILAAPLLENVLEKNRVGQARPATYPVSAVVRNAVREYVSNSQELQEILMARQSIEPEAGITILLSASGPLQPGVKDELIQIVRVARKDKDLIVRVFALLEASTTKP